MADSLKIYKPSEFAEMIGVSVGTLQRWDRDGVLVANRSMTNRRYYTQQQYLQYTGLQEKDVKPAVSPFMGRPSKRPPVEELIALYQTMPVREIAKKYGVKRSTVSAWMTRLRQSGELDDSIRQK